MREFVRFDRARERRRTRIAMGWSGAVHAVLFLLLALLPRTEAASVALTEIAYLEPGEAGAPEPVAGAPAARPQAEAGASAENVEDVRYERIQRQAEVAPAPQSWAAFGDRLNSKLAAMQRVEVAGPAGLDPTQSVGSGWAPAGVTGSAGGSGDPLALRRGGTGGSGPALDLTRGPSGGRTGIPAVAGTDLPAGDGRASAPARENESAARRQLAGATLIGPLADREIVSMARPRYPEWAKEDAVEASVTLYFLVREDGGVRDNVVIEKTAGFQDFDESAREALRRWRFAPLGRGATGEQWGTITFHFRIRDAG